jgi:23S rRNA (adenine2503-C2)-methyltransferase
VLLFLPDTVMPAPRSIQSFALAELRETLSGLGFKAYRAAQVFQWVYRHDARSFSEMTSIAAADRERLASLFTIASLPVLRSERSTDGTRKFLFGLADGHAVESVLIPDEDRQTLCISSQVGCGQACRFCLTGGGGFVRDLRADEIVQQVLEALRLLREEGAPPLTNIVLMGMGEPLANFDEVARALAVMTGEHGLGVSPRRITLSTAGHAPGIDRLARSGIPVNLAVSLNASTDEVRDRIMPINRRWPLAELLAACRRYPLGQRRRITFEYVLLGSVNDSEEDARRVARLLRGIRCKVNLIPFNPFPGCGFERPDDRAVRRFQRVLLDHHLTAPVRESRGRDISAACGQLREPRPAAAPTQ